MLHSCNPRPSSSIAHHRTHTPHSMRLSSIQWLLCAASSTATAASAAAAKVLVLDSDVTASSPPASQETTDPDTARLILAQRLGLGQYHSVAGSDEESIRQINAFGVQQRALFGADRHAEPVSKLLVMIEGVDYDAEKEIRSMGWTRHRTCALYADEVYRHSPQGL